MWTNQYEPTEKGWYLVKINGEKMPCMWNNPNKFFVDHVGKIYKLNQIDCWLDDNKVGSEVIEKKVIESKKEIKNWVEPKQVSQEERDRMNKMIACFFCPAHFCPNNTKQC